MNKQAHVTFPALLDKPILTVWASATAAEEAGQKPTVEVRRREDILQYKRKKCYMI